MSADFNLTDILLEKRKQDIANAHLIVDALKRCWLVEAELFDRLDAIERQNNLTIYETFGHSAYLACRDLREKAGKRCPLNPPEIWDRVALRRKRQLEECNRLLGRGGAEV